MAAVTDEGTHVHEQKDVENEFDVDTQISMKQSLIQQVMGKEEGDKLVKEIEQDAKKYLSDSRPMVKALAHLFLHKDTKKMGISDLYVLVQTLQSQIQALQGNISDVHKAHRKWTRVGTLNGIEKLVEQYSTLEYEFGVQYNTALGCVHKVIFNAWNRGIRMSTLHSYPMGDNSKQLKYGRVVWTKGLDDYPDKTKWYHHYIYETGDQFAGSNGVADPAIFVRPM
mmetsp:Transcript_62319/g.99102  ORF Transcript_62319/g.99102 Transcript_62319/m.99102 type:complete len:225 (-) Transcript_62319:123-797(-)